MALPVLAVALVAHPSIAGCCAAAAATLVGKRGRGDRAAKALKDTCDAKEGSKARQKVNRATYG